MQVKKRPKKKKRIKGFITISEKYAYAYDLTIEMTINLMTRT